MHVYRNYIKRLLDLVTAVIGLIMLSPIFLVVMVGLYVVNNGKPFFLQWRPGKDEKLFRIIKFKTMNDKEDLRGNLLPDDQRLTSIGSFIRKTSLDEIPQLLNVLKGDMSLIGPRPLLVKYLPFFTERERLRHTVRPGITGLAQVNGRNTLAWDARLEMDVRYVQSLSFQTDLFILYKTVKKVITSENVVVITNNNLKDLSDERKDRTDTTS